MSVVSSIRTNEGLVIGSDGRVSDYSGKVLTDEEQKVHAISREDISLAYGLFGTARIGDSDNDTTMFDFRTEVNPVVTECPADNWWRFMTSVGETLTTSLNEARKAFGKPMDNAEKLTWIVLGGFFGKHLKLGHIAITHGLTESTFAPSSYPPGFSYPLGSLEVFKLIDGSDPLFAKYAQPPRLQVRTLMEGIERVRNDILAHFEPCARTVDPDTCGGIGGRVQIATITSSGFSWIPGYEPVISSRP